MSDSVRAHRQQPTRLHCPWDSPGKNTGVGCHFLLQCMKVKSESEFAQSCPTLSNPMDFSLPGSSVHGIFEARVLEWGAILRQMLKYCIYLKFPTIDSKKEKSYCTALSRSVSKFKKQVILNCLSHKHFLIGKLWTYFIASRITHFLIAYFLSSMWYKMFS